jgi:hypothetical protein
MVTGNDGFDFGDGLVLPRGSSFTFLTLNMRLDSDVYQQPELFEGLRFHRMQKNQNQGQEYEGDSLTSTGKRTNPPPLCLLASLDRPNSTHVSRNKIF